MAIKNSGNRLKFSEIEDEFGQNPQRSLGSYQTTHPDFGNKNLGELTNLPLDTGIPTSGEIKFSDLTRSAFNNRRKAISNSLKDFFSSDELLSLGLNPKDRAQDLSIETYEKLTNFFMLKVKKKCGP